MSQAVAASDKSNRRASICTPAYKHIHNKTPPATTEIFSQFAATETGRLLHDTTSAKCSETWLLDITSSFADDNNKSSCFGNWEQLSGTRETCGGGNIDGLPDAISEGAGKRVRRREDRTLFHRTLHAPVVYTPPPPPPLRKGAFVRVSDSLWLLLPLSPKSGWN